MQKRPPLTIQYYPASPPQLRRGTVSCRMAGVVGLNPLRFVYHTGGAAVEVPDAQHEAGKAAFEKQFPLTGIDPETVATEIGQRYSPAEYQNAIKAYVESVTTPEESDLRQDLITRSTASYRLFYDVSLDRLKAEIADEKEDNIESFNAIRTRAHDHLDGLRDEVEAFRLANIAGEAASKAPAAPYAGRDVLTKVPIVGTPLRKTPIIADAIVKPLARFVESDYQKYLDSKEKSQESFADYLNDLHSAYLSRDLEYQTLNDREGEDSVDDLIDLYDQYSDRLKDGMEQRYMHKLELLFFEGVTKEELVKLQTDLAAEYKAIARGDGHLDLGELTGLVKAADYGPIDLKDLSLNAPSDRILRRLELLHMMRPEVWLTVVTQTTDELINVAVANNNQNGVIQFVKDYYVTIGRPLPEDPSFAEAKDKLLKIVDLRAAAGVKETMAILTGQKGIYAMANGAFAEPFNELPERLRKTTAAILDQFDAESMVPANPYDKLLVDFVYDYSASKREEVLATEPLRRELFLAIKIATEDYQSIYEKSYQNRVEGGSGQREVGGDPARLMAIITLGKTSLNLVRNMGQEAAYKILRQQEPLLFEEGKYRPDLKFKIEQKISRRYISRASLGGFNGVDLGNNLLQVLAGATLFANVMESKLHSHENPYVWAAAGVLAVEHYKDELPGGPIRYVKAGEAERQMMMTHLSLNQIVKRKDLTKEDVVYFCHNGAEFEMMRQLRAGEGQFKELIEKARERQKKTKSPYAFITREDLEALGGEAKAKAFSVPSDLKQARVRFEFYSRMLAGKKDLNVTQLKEHCDGYR